VFVDQSGFYLLPTVVRTYAPVGQTPVLHEQLTRDHLSVMSGITLEGKLLMIEQDRAFKGPDAVRFLEHALRQIPGKLLVIWDGSPIHRGQAVGDFLASGAASRLQLELLPGYAPESNPDEANWKHLKYVELKKRLLPEPLGVTQGVTQSQRALETQEARHPRLHPAAGPGWLDV
jgi:transposase